jgi:hypothetical protein
MKIKLWPDLVSWPLAASVSGDVITINGEKIDLSGIPEGFRLPGSAVGNNCFVGTEYVERINGVLHFTLFLPVAWESPEHLRNPATPIILDVTEGDVPFPVTAPPVVDVFEPTPVLEEPEDGGLEPA